MTTATAATAATATNNNSVKIAWNFVWKMRVITIYEDEREMIETYVSAYGL